MWDHPTMILKLDSKRRLTIPAKLAPATPGEYFEALYDEDEDKIIFRRVKRKRNWLEVWKRCPVPMNDLPARSRERSKIIKP
jgi:bifunctional DNA-binding transcriptional regulator/antitoxin component of YhaV-PrlF toxin-antitoxin module